MCVSSSSAASQNIRSEYFESRTDTSQGTAPAPSGLRPSESAASTPPRRDASRPASARETQSRGSELLRQSTRLELSTFWWTASCPLVIGGGG